MLCLAVYGVEEGTYWGYYLEIGYDVEELGGAGSDS